MSQARLCRRPKFIVRAMRAIALFLRRNQMRTFQTIAKVSAAALSIAALGIAFPAFAASVGGAGFAVGGAPAPGGGAPGGAPSPSLNAGGHFSSAAVGAHGPNANFAANPAGRMGHMGHGHFQRGYGGNYGYGYGYGWGYPDYAYGYDYPYDEGYYDNGEGYAGAEGSYCQTPVRSCGISEPAAVGTPCGCQSRTGTVWGRVQ
jgi:hypothetical protein